MGRVLWKAAIDMKKIWKVLKYTILCIQLCAIVFKNKIGLGNAFDVLFMSVLAEKLFFSSSNTEVGTIFRKEPKEPTCGS